MINFIENHKELFIFIFTAIFLFIFLIVNVICNAISKNKEDKRKKEKDLFLILIEDPQKFTHIAFTLLIVMLGVILGLAIGYDFATNKGDNIDKYINHILALLGIKLGGDKLLNNKKNEEES
jgi:uncharacterized membrane protein YbjE (DUF340 family)